MRYKVAEPRVDQKLLQLYRIDEKTELLAEWRPSRGWTLIDHRFGHLTMEDQIETCSGREISEEEAAMLLFQCEGST